MTGGGGTWVDRQSKKPVSIKLTISAAQVPKRVHFNTGRSFAIPPRCRSITILMSLSSSSKLDCTCALSFFSSLSVRAAISAVCPSSLSCSLSAKLLLIAPVLFVNAPLQPQPVAALGVLDGQIVLALPCDPQTCLGESLDHAGAVPHCPPLDQGRDIGVDGVPAVIEPEAVPLPRLGPLEAQIPRPCRIIRACPAMRQVQRVPQLRKTALPAGRRDIQRPPAGQLHARGHEMQLHPPAAGVLMTHPGDVILLGIQTGEGKRLELIHGLALLILGWGVLRGEGQHPVRIGPVPRDAVDQLGRARHVALHHLRRRRLPPLPLMVQQIRRNRAAAPASAGGELDQHQPPPSPLSADGASGR